MIKAIYIHFYIPIIIVSIDFNIDGAGLAHSIFSSSLLFNVISGKPLIKRSGDSDLSKTYFPNIDKLNRSDMYSGGINQ